MISFVGYLICIGLDNLTCACCPGLCQAESWIEDKLKIAKQESFKNVRDIQDKMKSLKKHQAFEAEIMANADLIRAIKQVGI
jgi:hypothetical protein